MKKIVSYLIIAMAVVALSVSPVFAKEAKPCKKCSKPKTECECKCKKCDKAKKDCECKKEKKEKQ